MSTNDEHHDDIEIELEEEALTEKEKKKNSLKGKLKAAKDEAKTNLDGWQRARADYVNLQKQFDDEKSLIRARTIESFVLELLPALDTFDMAMRDKATWESVDEKWRKGIEYIYDQLQTTLQRYNISVIDALKGTFDPQKHEPLEIIETEEEEQDGMIIEVLQKGYCMGEKVIRPAKVKIYKFKS